MLKNGIVSYNRNEASGYEGAKVLKSWVRPTLYLRARASQWRAGRRTVRERRTGREENETHCPTRSW